MLLGCRGRPPPRPRTRSRPRSIWQRASQTLFFDNENEDDDEDEKQYSGHFRHLPLMSLHSNCPTGALFSERSLGKSIGPYRVFSDNML
jgi:hypothetical protein